MARCSNCGRGGLRKTVRAMIVSDNAAPRTGLVCKVCAACGLLVVPAVLRMLPAKPRRVPRSALVEGVLRQVVIAPKGGDS